MHHEAAHNLRRAAAVLGVAADSLALCQGVAKADEQLLGHEEHLRYRFAQYLTTKEAIEQKEGSLQSFAKVRLLSFALPCTSLTCAANNKQRSCMHSSKPQSAQCALS